MTTRYTVDEGMGVLARTSPFLIFTVISVAYGLQYRFEEGQRLETLTTYFRVVSIPFVMLFLVVSLSLKGRFWVAATKLGDGRTKRFGLMLIGLSLTLTLYFQSKALPFAVWLTSLLLVAGTLFWCLREKVRPGCAGLLMALGVALYILLVYTTPHTSQGDMLGLVETASREFLSGKSPYHVLPHSELGIPFMYLPALWLPYAPLVLTNLDVRVVNLVCLGIWILLMSRAGARGNSGSAMLWISFFPVVLSNSVANAIVGLQVWPYWIFMLLTMYLGFQRRYLAASVFLGLALGARQSALFVCAPLAVYLYRTVGLRRTTQYALIAIGTYLAVVLPFALWTGLQFWLMEYAHLSSLSGSPVFVGYNISASTYLEAAGALSWTGYVQGGLVILSALLVMRKKQPDFGWVVYLCGIFYVWLVLFNPTVMRYYLYLGIFLMVLGLVMGPEKDGEVGGSLGQGRRA